MLLFRRRALKEVLVATRCGAPQAFAGASFIKMNSRSAHTARDDITSLKIVLVNWYMNNATETGSGANITFTASIEYPAATFTQITFNTGSTSVALASGGSVTSDALSIAIPNGAQFWVRTFQDAPSGVIYQTFGDATFGDKSEMSAGALNDHTMTGTITTGGANILHPFAIIGMSRKPAVALFMDSMWGSNDTADGTTGDIGLYARWIGPSFAYCSLGASGEKAQTFAATNGAASPLRRAILPYCTHSLFNLGSNDIFASRTVAQFEADVTSCCKLSRAQGVIPMWGTTPPRPSSSSDHYTTGPGQSLDTSNETHRITANGDLLAGTVQGVEHTFDVAQYLQDPVIAGAYITDGVNQETYTIDGIHGKAAAYQLPRDGLTATAQSVILRAY